MVGPGPGSQAFLKLLETKYGTGISKMMLGTEILKALSGLYELPTKMGLLAGLG